MEQVLELRASDRPLQAIGWYVPVSETGPKRVPSKRSPVALAFKRAMLKKTKRGQCLDRIGQVQHTHTHQSGIKARAFWQALVELVDVMRAF